MLPNQKNGTLLLLVTQKFGLAEADFPHISSYHYWSIAFDYPDLAKHCHLQMRQGLYAFLEVKFPDFHWEKLTCFTICRKHGISVELAWNHENSTSIPHCGNFKFHITYAEAGYQLWN